jgi:hypothetical protein
MDTSFNSLLKSSVLEIFSDPEIKEKTENFLISSALKAYQIIADRENSQKLLTIADVAKLFGKSKVCIHDWAKRGILIKHKIKGTSRTYFKLSEVEQALIEMKTFKSL